MRNKNQQQNYNFIYCSILEKVIYIVHTSHLLISLSVEKTQVIAIDYNFYFHFK